jgi:glycosyltransferase involved in cell wall biosynthesis
MSDNKYVVKSLTAWMMDELISFSKLANYDLILLRQPDKFFVEQIQVLEENGVNIYIKPYSFDLFIRKSLIILKFITSNIVKFEFNYNFVVGLKSIYWFLRIDLKHFSSNSKIHAQFATQAAVLSLLVKNFYSNKPLLSFTFHAYDIYSKNKWFNLLISNCHKAISISEFNIEYVNKKYVSSDKIILSRLGVFKNKIKKSEKIGAEIFNLGLMSWFVEKKGINYLLEAFKILKNDGFENIRLKLAGDGPLKEEILSYIDENNLTNSIEYIGKIKGHDKDKFYNSLDVFVLPSVSLKNDQDGIPVVLMEAIAYGLPLVSTKVSGIPEICINNYNGILINQRDVNNLYDAIMELYKSDKKRKIYSNNSLKLSEEYDIVDNSKRKLLKLGWI